MPRMPDHPCAHPGCPRLVRHGEKYCEAHRALHPGEVRSATTRGYNGEWRKARTAFLHAHPFCAECMKRGVFTKATVVDHITPHRGDYNLFWDRSNWQSLCKGCHDVKTGKEDRYVVYQYQQQG